MSDTKASPSFDDDPHDYAIQHLLEIAPGRYQLDFLQTRTYSELQLLYLDERNRLLQQESMS